LKDPVERLSPTVLVNRKLEDGIEFRLKELSVHCLVLAFFFAVILFFDLSGLSFNLSGLSFCTHQMM